MGGRGDAYALGFQNCVIHCVCGLRRVGSIVYRSSAMDSAIRFETSPFNDPSQNQVHADVTLLVVNPRHRCRIVVGLYARLCDARANTMSTTVVGICAFVVVGLSIGCGCSPPIDPKRMRKCEQALSDQFRRPVAVRVESSFALNSKPNLIAFVQMPVGPNEDMHRIQGMTTSICLVAYPQLSGVIIESVHRSPVEPRVAPPLPR